VSNREQDARFRRLYEAHYPSAFRYIVGLGFPREEARDLAQTAFLRVFRAMGTVGTLHPEAERTYIMRAARSVALNEIRDRIRRRRWVKEVSWEALSVVPDSLPKDPWTAEPSATPESELVATDEAKRRRQWLNAAISDLPDSLRSCLLLRLSGRKYREIAQALGITLDAVKTRLYEAQKRLRERLGDELEGVDLPAASGEDDDDQEK
jgi:RNA polymerase sigma-70 factor (ECF subfamily)